MASSGRQIADFLALRGLALRQVDVDEVAAMLAILPIEQHDEIAPNIWEAVMQIVADPTFEGEVAGPDAP